MTIRWLALTLIALGLLLGAGLTQQGAAAPATIAQVSAWPIVPVIDASLKARLRVILADGAARGNRAGVFAKIGDSISESQAYLQGIACAEEDLGSDTALAPTITFFRATNFPADYTAVWCEVADSFSRSSVSAVSGWTANDALAPLDPPRNDCPTPYESALRCELHLIRPAIALLMYGTNDLEADADPALYQAALTQVVQETIAAGVIPVLSTIPPRLDDPTMGARVETYNQAIVAVAQAQQIPLWNYWLALQDDTMINQGLSEDGVHPNLYGGCAPECLPVNFTTEGLRYGYNQRNLTALQVLAKLKTVVLDDGPPDSSGTPTASECVRDVNANGRGDLIDIMTAASQPACYPYVQVVAGYWHRPWPE
jgi:hypothetical protein